LENLTSIGGYLSIGGQQCPDLPDGAGEPDLHRGFIFILVHNNALTSLTGLENLTSIGGYLLIMDNNALTSLTGLESLTSIGDHLSIRETPP
jgi:hypothetical protein